MGVWPRSVRLWTKRVFVRIAYKSDAAVIREVYDGSKGWKTKWFVVSSLPGWA